MQNERPGRLRAAWSVLMGQRLTPFQIQAEWFEYKQTFDDILKRFSAQLARQAKAERKRLTALMDTAEAGGGGGVPANRKAWVRARAAALRGLTPLPRGNAAPDLLTDDDEGIE